MTRRFFNNELSDSAGIVQLLDLGITATQDILNICRWFRARNWERLLTFFSRKKISWPSMFPIGADPSPSLVRLVRSRWRRGQRPKPRRKAGLPPLRRRKKAGRKFLTKSDHIRALLDQGYNTEQIKSKLGVTANLIRQVRFRKSEINF